jgi:hypothetical protein
MTLTAKELARQVAGSAAEEDLVFRRVRAWTVEGLLTPEGELNPGTGRSRHYSTKVLPKARTLNRLTDCGVTAQTLRLVSIFMDKGHEDFVSHFGSALYLLITKLPNQEERSLSIWTPTERQPSPLNIDAEYTIVVKLW